MNKSNLFFLAAKNNNGSALFLQHFIVFVVSGLCILQSLNALRGAITISESGVRDLTFNTIYFHPECDRCVEKGKSLCWSVVGFGLLALHLSHLIVYQPVSQYGPVSPISAEVQEPVVHASGRLSAMVTRTKLFFSGARRSKVKAIIIPTAATIAVVVYRTTSLHAYWTFIGASGNLTRDIMLFLHMMMNYIALYAAFVIATIVYYVRQKWCNDRNASKKEKADQAMEPLQPSNNSTNSNTGCFRRRHRQFRVFLLVVVFTLLSFTLLDTSSSGAKDRNGFVKVEELPTVFDRFAPSFLKQYPDIYDMRSTATGGKYSYDCSAFNESEVATPETLEAQDDDNIQTLSSPGEYEEDLPVPVAPYIPRWFARLLAKPQVCPPSSKIVPEFSHYGESPNRDNKHAVIVAGICPAALAADDENGVFGSSIAGNIGSESFPRPLVGGGNGVGIAKTLKRKYKRTKRPIIVVEDLEANFIGKMAHRTSYSSSRAKGSETCSFSPDDRAIGGRIGENWQREVNARYGGVSMSQAGKSVSFYCQKTKRKYVVTRNRDGHVERVVIDLNDVEARQLLREPVNDVLETYTDASLNAIGSRKRQREDMLRFFTALGLSTRWRHPTSTHRPSTTQPRPNGDSGDHLYVYTLEPGARLVTVLCGDVEEFHVGRIPHVTGTRHFSSEERLIEEHEWRKGEQTAAMPAYEEPIESKKSGNENHKTEEVEEGGEDEKWKRSKAWKTRKHQRIPKVNGIHVLFLDAISRPGVLRQLPRTVKWLRKRSFEAMLRHDDENSERKNTANDGDDANARREGVSKTSPVAVEFPGYTTVNPNTIGNINALLGGHTIQTKFEDDNTMFLDNLFFQDVAPPRRQYKQQNAAHYKRYLRENNIFAKAKERYLMQELYDDENGDLLVLPPQRREQGNSTNDKQRNFTAVDRMFTAHVHEHAEDSQELYWGSSSTSNTTGHGDHHRDIDAHYISHAAHRFNCEESNFEGLSSIQRRCFGRREAVEVNLRLVHSLVNQAIGQDKKFLIFSHFLEGHEVTLTQGDAQDDHVVRYFHELESEGFFENNVVILMTDHGNHMGPQIELAPRVGHTERRMPFLSLLLPQQLARKHKETLRSNREQLVGAFDIHGTILDLLGLDDELPDHASHIERTNGTFYCTSFRLGGHNATRTTNVTNKKKKNAVRRDDNNNNNDVDTNTSPTPMSVKETYKRIPSLMRPFDIKRNTCMSVRSQRRDCVLSAVCQRKKK